MRVAIISVYVDFLRKGEKSRGVLQPGIGPLIAGLLPHDIEIDIINETVRDIEWNQRYDLVFISCLHPDVDRARQISHYFRNRGAKTVIGNIFASTYPDLCAPYFDSVVVGDAEAAIPVLWDDFCSGRLKERYESLPETEVRTACPRFDLIASEAIVPIALEATKGCPYHCNFCALTAAGVRFKTPLVTSITNVIREGQAALNNGSVRRLMQRKMVSFLDNNLGGNPTYFKQFCRELKSLNIFWGAALTLNVLEDEETIRLMADSGCYAVFVGLESFNQEALDDMAKPQNDVKALRRIIETCRRHGILFNSGLVIDPNVDDWSYLKTIPEQLEESGLHIPSFISFASPIPGTPLFYELAGETNGFLPNVLLRDLTGYTLTVQPKRESVAEHIRGYTWLLDTVYSTAALKRRLSANIGLVHKNGLRGMLGSIGELFYYRTIRRSHLSDPNRSYCAGSDLVPPEASNIPFENNDFTSEQQRRSICSPWEITDDNGEVLSPWLTHVPVFKKK